MVRLHTYIFNVGSFSSNGRYRHLLSSLILSLIILLKKHDMLRHVLEDRNQIKIISKKLNKDQEKSNSVGSSEQENRKLNSGKHDRLYKYRIRNKFQQHTFKKKDGNSAKLYYIMKMWIPCHNIQYQHIYWGTQNNLHALLSMRVNAPLEN